MSSGKRKSRHGKNSEKPQREFTVSIEYVPMPEHMKSWVYDEWVRIFNIGVNNEIKNKQHRQ